MNDSLKIILGWGVGILLALIFVRTRFAKSIVATKEEQKKLGMSGLEKILGIMSIGCLVLASFMVYSSLKWLFWVLMVACISSFVGLCFVRRQRIKVLRK
jgi:hypothetical protein